MTSDPTSRCGRDKMPFRLRRPRGGGWITKVVYILANPRRH